MDFETAFTLLESVLEKETGKSLNLIQKQILESAFYNQSYESLATNINYDAGYLKKDIGPKIWRLLSDVFKQDINKKNFRLFLENFAKNNDLLRETTTMNQEETKIWEMRISSKEDKIKELEARLNDANQKIEELEDYLKSLIKELDEAGINIPTLDILKNKLQKINVEENLKICKALEEFVRIKQKSWAEEAVTFVLNKYSELTYHGGLLDSQEKRSEFYKDVHKYLEWIIFGLNKTRILPLDKIKIDRTVDYKILYRDAFKFIRDQKIFGLEAKESEMLKTYLKALIDFLS